MFMERRSAARYPIILSAHYEAVRKRSGTVGVGKTVDISSGGLLILSEHNVRVGIRLEVTMEWPALLDGEVELVLVATGQVVRARESNFALKLSRYEFRTVKRKFRSQSAAIGHSAAVATDASTGSSASTALARFRVPELST